MLKPRHPELHIFGGIAKTYTLPNELHPFVTIEIVATKKVQAKLDEQIRKQMNVVPSKRPKKSWWKTVFGKREERKISSVSNYKFDFRMGEYDIIGAYILDLEYHPYDFSMSRPDYAHIKLIYDWAIPINNETVSPNAKPM